jgi:hypothetical protein
VADVTATITSVSSTMKDFFPLPGTRIKQYVVDTRREHAWERETSPRIDVPEHDDNCGSPCRNIGSAPWPYLDHDSCHVCGVLHEYTSKQPDVVVWLAMKAKRPPVEADRTKLSDEIAPEWPSMADHPLAKMLPKEKP